MSRLLLAGASLLLLAGHASAGDLKFGTPVKFQTARAPHGLATGDLNGDGAPDFVVCGGGGQFALHRSDGKGSLGKAGYLSSKKDGTTVAMADFDRDGKVDVAITGKTVVVHYGNGKGNLLKEKEKLRCGKRPGQPVAGDVDGDGRVDLIVPHREEGKVSVFLRGEEKFERPTRYKVRKGAEAAAVGDMNGDGHPDLVVLSGATTNKDLAKKKLRLMSLEVLLGGDKKLVPTKKPVKLGLNWYQDLELHDFNGDGHLDALTSNVTAKGVVVYPGDGKGGFGKGGILKTGFKHYDVAAADLDKDGDLDLVLGGDQVPFGIGDETPIVIALGDGEGTFTLGPEIELKDEPWMVAIADVTGDGKLDVVVTTERDDLVVVPQVD